MIFLKSIYCTGFKSFANVTEIPFKYNLSGIIGPNGSGKSNVVDAIRWALGEISNKSLRGGEVSDFLFKGTSDIPPKNIAEVRLTFNNTRHYFDKTYEEIEISRIFNLVNNENTYFINQTQVRRKDVINFALKTNLHRNALGIISQGQIAEIAEASREVRRKFFDNAMGIYAYKKQKKDCLRRLINAQTNLDKLTLIKNEVYNQLPNLKRKSTIASKYQSYDDALRNLEFGLLVLDINKSQTHFQKYTSDKRDLKDKWSVLNTSINELENRSNELSQFSYQLDNKINTLQKKYKIITDEIGELKLIFVNLRHQKQDEFLSHQEQQAQKETYALKSIHLKSSTKQLANLQDKLQVLNKKMIMSEDDLKTWEQKLNVINFRLVELEFQKNNVIKNQTNTNGHIPNPVKVLFEHQKFLIGIVDTINNLFNYESEHALALKVALGARQHNVVVENFKNIQELIKFAKNNHLNRITFLPLDNLKPSYLTEEELFIAEHSTGFIGIACDLIDCDPKYDMLATFLLGRIIIAQDYTTALRLSRLIKQKREVITLDGTSFKAYGPVVSNNYSTIRHAKMTYQQTLEKFTDKINQLAKLQNLAQQNIAKLKVTLKNNQNLINQLQFKIGSNEKDIQTLNNTLLNLKTVYAKRFNVDIAIEGMIEFDTEQHLTSISEKETTQNNISDQINLCLQQKNSNQNEYETIATYIKDKRSVWEEVNNKLLFVSKKEGEYQATGHEALETLLQKYQITFEEACTEIDINSVKDSPEIRDQVRQLRYKIKNYGNVDLNSIQEYDTALKRYENLKNEIGDLQKAINKLNNLISKIDELMAKRFMGRMEATNQCINEIFAIFFPNGTIRLLLEEPNDFLASPIHIKLSIPGKKITRLTLLSGGEKTVVALIILFAILRVQKLPLIILDEAEAALDAHNVALFIKYIKEFSQLSQFIIITHNRLTMERCDLLHAFTMPENGVTTIISAHLKDQKSLVFD